MKSNAINEALSLILKSPITYLAFVQHKEEHYFLCIGSHSFFIVDSKLETVKAEVFFAHVQRLILDTSKNKYIFLQLHENRDPNVPLKLILSTENRPALVEQIKSAWKADHMFRLGQVQDLPVFQSEVSVQNNDNTPKKIQLPSYILEPYQGWDKYEHKKYKFFIPNSYKQQNKNDLTFFCLNSQKKPISKISIQISDNIPLDALSYMDGKEEMNVYCEEFANKLAAKESKVWIVSSKSYSKRSNLNQDIACWQGWEVHLRTPKKDILIVMLRRKYIPPLLDHFVDFAVVIEGAEKNLNPSAKISKIEKQLSDPLFVVTFGRKVADSFYANFTTLTIYDSFIQARVDSLYYDEETMNYLQFRLPTKIKPNYMLYGVAFLSSIVENLKKLELDQNILPIDIDMIPQMLNEKYKDEPEIEEIIEETDPFYHPPPWFKVKQALEEKLVGGKKKNQADQQYAAWASKVSKFFAYCVDGGLLNFFFTLNTLVESYIKHSKEQGSEVLNQIILYLLHFRSEKECFDEESPLATQIYDMIYSKENYVYNEKVMINLIEIGYFQKELGGSDKPLLYSKFLTYMLETSTNPFIKYAICRQIIKDQNEKKQSSVNVDINLVEVKALIKPILRLYQGDNSKLATLAAISLASLCSKTREIKQFIMQEGDEIIIMHLSPKDEDLLKYTLQLLEYLMLVNQNVQTFLSKGVDKKIFEILEGSSIPGVLYSDEVLTLACQVLGLIVSNVEEYRRLIIDKIDLIMGLFDLERTRPISEALVAEIMNLFLIKMSDKDQGAIDFIGFRCLDVFFKKLREDFFKTKDMQNRILTFLLRFKESEEIMIKIRLANIVPKIREFMRDQKTKATALLKEIEGPQA